MVLPQWSRRAIRGCLDPYCADQGLYYSIIVLLCQPFFGGAHRPHYAVMTLSLLRYLHHYTLYHYLYHYTLCHYAVPRSLRCAGHWDSSLRCASLRCNRLHCLNLGSLCVFWVVPRSHLRLRLISLLFYNYNFSLTKLQGGECSILFFWLSHCFYWVFWWGAVPNEVFRITSWYCWIFLDAEPPGIGSVLDSGIYNLMLTFPAFWNFWIALIPLLFL